MSDSYRHHDDLSLPPMAPPARPAGSPFVVRRPLRADEPIFGRDAAFRFIAGQLARFSPINVVGERRMGKTSLLNHLLLQPSDHPLTVAEAAEARCWAGGHPCHLQATGAAWYQARAEGRGQEWVRGRREELKAQNCLVHTVAPARPGPPPRGRTTRVAQVAVHILRAIFVDAPLSVGRQIQRLGDKLDDVAG